MKEFIDTFENKNQKDNTHKLKMLVSLKISQDETRNELNYFKSRLEKYINKYDSEIKIRNSNKNNIETNYKLINDKFNDQIKLVTSNINELKQDLLVIKKPLTEYVDMLTREYDHLVQQSKVDKEHINSMLSDYNGMGGNMGGFTDTIKKHTRHPRFKKTNNKNLLSPDFSISLPGLNDRYSSDDKFSDVIKSNRLKDRIR